MAFRSTSTKLMAGVSRSKNFRLTLEQLRIYKKVGYYISPSPSSVEVQSSTSIYLTCRMVTQRISFCFVFVCWRTVNYIRNMQHSFIHLTVKTFIVLPSPLYLHATNTWIHTTWRYWWYLISFEIFIFYYILSALHYCTLSKHTF